MSVYYIVKEHLSIKHVNREYRYEPIDAVTEQVASLAEMMMLDQATIHSAKLLADGKEYTFSGKEVTPELHALVRALSHAEEVDFVATFSFYEWGRTLSGADIGDVVREAVEKQLKENPAEAENIFYSVYNGLEWGVEGVGNLLAYGNKGGKHYNGLVEDIAELPTSGDWNQEDCTVAYGATSEELVGKDVEAIERACLAFSELENADVDFDRDEKGVDFSLSGVFLKTKEDFEKYIALCAELFRVTDGECSTIAKFVDFSQDDARTIDLDFDAEGNCTVKMLSV